jgi:hypothetical protein
MNQIFVSCDGARYLVEYEGTIEVTCLAGALMLAGSVWSVTEIDWTAGRLKIEGRQQRADSLYWHGLPPFVVLDLKPAPWLEKELARSIWEDGRVLDRKDKG